MSLWASHTRSAWTPTSRSSLALAVCDEWEGAGGEDGAVRVRDIGSCVGFTLKVRDGGMKIQLDIAVISNAVRWKLNSTFRY